MILHPSAPTLSPHLTSQLSPRNCGSFFLITNRKIYCLPITTPPPKIIMKPVMKPFIGQSLFLILSSPPWCVCMTNKPRRQAGQDKQTPPSHSSSNAARIAYGPMGLWSSHKNIFNFFILKHRSGQDIASLYALKTSGSTVYCTSTKTCLYSSPWVHNMYGNFYVLTQENSTSAHRWLMCKMKFSPTTKVRYCSVTKDVLLIEF